MNRHPHHNLRMHDDEALSQHIGSKILKRQTIHEWPLSCVQIVDLANGEKLVYKSQFGPTVESAFYSQAKSPLLPRAQTLYEQDGYSCMIFEFIDAPHMRDVEQTPEEGLVMCEALLAELRNVEGTPPCFIDISSPEKWHTLVNSTVSDLRELIRAGQLAQTTADTVATLERCSLTFPVLSAMQTDVGLLHGDPSGDNVFVLLDGFRVIDWQRTMRGPRAIDKTAFVDWFGLDPVEHVDPGAVAAWYFLSVSWLTQCKKQWIPDGRSYDGTIVELTEKMSKALE